MTVGDIFRPNTEPETMRGRRWVGYVLGLIGFGCVLGPAYLALKSINQIDVAALAAPNHRQTVALLAVKVGGEALISIALVYFGYQMLKAAERMVLPHWWATKENLPVVRTMLGIDSPVDGAGRALKEAGESVQTVAKTAVDAIGVVRGEKKDGKG